MACASCCARPSRTTLQSSPSSSPFSSCFCSFPRNYPSGTHFHCIKQEHVKTRVENHDFYQDQEFKNCSKTILKTYTPKTIHQIKLQLQKLSIHCNQLFSVHNNLYFQASLSEVDRIVHQRNRLPQKWLRARPGLQVPVPDACQPTHR